MNLKCLIFVILIVGVNPMSIPCESLYKCQTCTFHGNCFFNINESNCKSKSEIPTTNLSYVINLPYNCPIPTPPKFAYTDDFGRNWAWRFSAATHTSETTVIKKCLEKVNSTFHSSFLVKCPNENSTCYAFIGLSHEEKAISLTFRGAQGNEQMNFITSDVKNKITKTSKYVDGKVLAYFIDSFETMWESGIEDSLQELKKEYPKYELWVFGHSLGGVFASIASFAAFKTKLFTSEEIKCITLGQLRTGTLEYAQAHDKYIPYTYRIIHATDGATKLPYKDPLSTDADDLFHHRYEVWYNNDMKVGDPYSINERGDDFSGSNIINISTISPFDTSHLVYFNDALFTYDSEHC